MYPLYCTVYVSFGLFALITFSPWKLHCDNTLKEQSIHTVWFVWSLSFLLKDVDVQ